jgi:hypothetical protein
VDARARSLIGWAIAAVGVVVAVVGGLADQLGLGGDGPDKFGPQQVAAVAVGAALVVVGLALALWWAPRAGPSAGEPPGH